MLSIKHSLHPVRLILLSLIATTACLTGLSNVLADDDHEYLRQEPIFPIPLTVEVNKAKANLGEILFYDTRLSKDNTIACASCHQLDEGGDDNIDTGVSMSTGQNNINTPSIFNARYNFRQNRDGSAKSLADQINMTMNNHHKFNNKWDNVVSTLSQDTAFNKEFSEVYKDGIKQDNIVDALVEFEKTLITPNSRFDQHLRSEETILTKKEMEGYIVFKELGCISCHQGINVGGNLYQKFGVFYNYFAERGTISKADYGRQNITNRDMDAFVFKVPSLRNITVTAPYLHDGSAKTIEEAISIMGKTQLGRALNGKEIFLIKEFLKTLTGEYKNKSLDAES